MLKLEKKSDLVALHLGNVKESLNLEYKASPSVDKRDDNKKIEMARDVSAFANADGGQIIYGMTEADHEPAGLDAGVDAKVYPEIWFEQILQQHVTPAISGLKIRHVVLEKQMVAVVIDVPASKGDPHQVSDGRYYRRHNYNRLVMEHYEVRDAMRRAIDPLLVLEFELFEGEAAYKNLTFSQFRDVSDPTDIGAYISNLSNQPAMYTVVSIFADQRMKIVDAGGFKNVGPTVWLNDGKYTLLRLDMGIPKGFPIFKEMPIAIGPFKFTISNRLLGQKLVLGYEIRSPGCFKQNHGHLEIGESGQMHLRMLLN